MIGEISGVKPGQLFPNRKALHEANVHRGLMRGISPGGESIVLSGGYADDIDDGDIIIYTGEGGRDQNSKKQISDQTLTGGNLNLANNFIEGNPIRVIRGGKLHSKYTPILGYRYDGLYYIENYWREKGKDGFDIIRFKLIRIEGQVQLPTEGGAIQAVKDNVVTDELEAPRKTALSTRIIRNTAIGNLVKQMYRNRCQICDLGLETPSGIYSECCHIKPLGRPHNGPDILENVICLCPNHHVLFDAHAIHISDDFKIVETGKSLILNPDHRLNLDYIRYHRFSFSNFNI